MTPPRTSLRTFDVVASAMVVLWSRFPARRDVGRVPHAAWGTSGYNDPRANVIAARSSDALSIALARLRTSAPAHTIQLHSDVDDSVAELLAGYEHVDTTEGMVHNDLGIVAPPRRRYRLVDGSEFAAFCAPAYGLGRADMLAIPERLGPLGYYLLIEEDGRPVSCGAGIVIGSSCFVFGVATPAPLRCAGRGRDATAAVLAEARRHSCRTAVLQSSTAGRTLYTSMGFDPVDVWEWWSTPSPLTREVRWLG